MVNENLSQLRKVYLVSKRGLSFSSHSQLGVLLVEGILSLFTKTTLSYRACREKIPDNYTHARRCSANESDYISGSFRWRPRTCLHYSCTPHPRDSCPKIGGADAGSTTRNGQGPSFLCTEFELLDSKGFALRRREPQRTTHQSVSQLSVRYVTVHLVHTPCLGGHSEKFAFVAVTLCRSWCPWRPQNQVPAAKRGLPRPALPQPRARCRLLGSSPPFGSSRPWGRMR